jgi:cytochrome c-type biogenesis protein CcmH/NrfG
MPPRFCPQCGTAASGGAKFCSQCGGALAGDPASVPESRWQLTAAGSAALALFLSGGLAIWTLILMPAQTKSLTRPAGAAATAGGELPEGHPRVPVALPAEVKSFIDDVAKKAKDNPKDVEAWSKLGMVMYRAAQLDASYYPKAREAFEHVLEIEPKNVDALRGVANVHYDRDEYKEAIPAYEHYLEVKPDDASARTDLGTMYLYAGDPIRAVATYRDVVKQSPSFLQAHYNLAVTYHQQGDDKAALAELGTARGLAPDDGVRKQIDDMIATISGGGAPQPAGDMAAKAAPSDGAPRSSFQQAVEQAFRGHPILGPRIVRFEWTGPGAGRVVVENFPMQGMPPAVRDKFTAHMGDELRTAQSAHQVEGPVRVEIADASSGAVMVTLTP